MPSGEFSQALAECLSGCLRVRGRTVVDGYRNTLGLHRGPFDDGGGCTNLTEDRFGRTVDDFFMNPTGTMSVVLSRQIILTPAEKQVAIQKLREAFAEHERQQAEAQGAKSQKPSTGQ